MSDTAPVLTPIELDAPFDLDTPLLVHIWRAAHLLECSESTVRRLIAAGELRATGQGKLRRVEYASILEYIARHRRSPAVLREVRNG